MCFSRIAKHIPQTQMAGKEMNKWDVLHKTHTSTGKFSAVPNVLCWISVLTSKSGLQSTFHSSIVKFQSTFHEKNNSQVSSRLFQPSPKNGCYIVFIHLKQKTACRHSWILVRFSLGVAPCDLKLHKYCGVRTNQRLQQGHQSLVKVW